MKPSPTNDAGQNRGTGLRINSQDLYALYAPSPCNLRIYLRAKGETEAGPGLFEVGIKIQ